MWTARTLRRAMAAAVLVLALTAAASSANLLRFSNRNIRAVWTQLRIANTLFAVECPVTMEGSFHANEIAKVEGNLIGYITRAIAANAGCGAGRIIFLGGFPWHVKYERYGGTLPNITSVLMRILNVDVNTERETFNCLYRSTEPASLHVAFTVAGGVVTSLVVNETALIPKAGGSAFCGMNAEVSKAATVTLLGTTNAINITLI